MDINNNVNKYSYDISLDNSNTQKNTFVDDTTSEEDYEEKRKKKYENAWNTLKSVDGVLVPGGFGTRGIEGKYLSSKYCRLHNVPYLGICLGMQTAVIDMTREFLNKNANSEEFEDIIEENNKDDNIINKEKEENKKDNTCLNINTKKLNNNTINFTKKNDFHKNNYNSDKININTFNNYQNNISEENSSYNIENDIENHLNQDKIKNSNIKSEDKYKNNTNDNELLNYDIETVDNFLQNHEYMNDVSKKLLHPKLLEKIQLMNIQDYYKSISEIDNNNVIISMTEFKGDNNKGGSMRLGMKKSKIIDKESLTYKLYDEATYIYERHRHRFEINPKYVPLLEAVGLSFVAKDIHSVRMEICEIKNLDFFIGVQFHPEFTSRPFKANPIFLAFVLASKKKLKERLDKYENKLYSGIFYKT